MKYLIALFLIALVMPTELYAQAQPMQTFVDNFPFWDGSGTGSYIEALYKIAISVAAILVVFRLMWAGVQYMFSEVVTNKQKAKDDIKSALLGLIVILGAVTILTTINPNLTNLDVVGNGTRVELASQQQNFTKNLLLGDSITNEGVKWDCSEGLLGSVDQECYQRQIDYYKRSCAENNGRLIQRYLTLWVLIGSSTWQCEPKSS